MGVEFESSASIPLCFVVVQQMAVEEHSARMTFDLKVQMKQRKVSDFLHAEKKNNHWHSLMTAKHSWRPNSGCEYSEAKDGAFQQ